MNPRDSVERFHLTFLRHFAPVVSPGTICLKGGANLRLFHSSPRLSEDIDFDVRIVAADTLAKNVAKVLGSQPLKSELAATGIGISEIRAAKQTQTTQRWKIQINSEEAVSPTRLEFSRRNDDPFDESAAEPPSLALLAEKKIVPFVFHHYLPRAAYRQKINALATRTQVQARDVFDLHHLSKYAAAARQAPHELVEQAMDFLAPMQTSGL
jgi:predicted nucleotidyltransferase component of viral defense system